MDLLGIDLFPRNFIIGCLAWEALSMRDGRILMGRNGFLRGTEQSRLKDSSEEPNAARELDIPIDPSTSFSYLVNGGN
jgi:hypothetical protein